MLGLDTLDVAIGLVFVYLMVSFVCSAATELMELIFKQRPRKLFDGITELVTAAWVKKLYEHPLVTSLYKDGYDGRRSNLPSYIPARNFALALLGLAQPGAAPAANNLQDIENRIKTLATTNPHLHEALNAIYLGAEGKAENVIKGIEDWYNSAMDRVSGWYKRYAQHWLLVFGAVAAIALNVDSIYIVKQLSINKTQRDAIVNSAAAAVSKPPAEHTPPATVEEAIKGLTKSIKDANTAGLPIGWHDDEHNKVDCWQLFVGWLLTAVAVSFGAPFWFDILNKLMVVRATVKPKEKSASEKSKDK
jgi:hypothetical protein